MMNKLTYNKNNKTELFFSLFILAYANLYCY